LEEALHFINSKPKPLALYIMSKSRPNIETIINETSAGGTAINEVMVTSINPELPFGGSNFSGIGKSNGWHSFLEFSNERGVVSRSWGTLSMIYPPYNKKLVSWLTKIAKL
jgi:aldehyde dehydrogenase (NAD+)